MSSIVIVIHLVLVSRPSCASEKEDVNKKGVNKSRYSLRKRKKERKKELQINQPQIVKHKIT
jgi:hypothetical protein